MRVEKFCFGTFDSHSALHIALRFCVFDEPEAALSPTWQMSMLVRMDDLIAEDSQFIIATHSPILMAYPDAWIYQLGQHGLERVAYEDTEHFAITRNFLNRHPEVVRQLLDGD